MNAGEVGEGVVLHEFHIANADVMDTSTGNVGEAVILKANPGRETELTLIIPVPEFAVDIAQALLNCFLGARFRPAQEED